MNLFYHTTHRLALHSRLLFLCLLASLTALPTFAQTTWTGASNSDWNSTANWLRGGVPTATDNATIPNVSPSPSPVIGAGTSAVAKSLIISNGAFLRILATGSLTINGSAGVGLTNSGTVVNAGSITIGSTVGLGSFGYCWRIQAVAYF